MYMCTILCIHCINMCSEYACLNSWCATEACFHKHVHRSAEVLLWSLPPPLIRSLLPPLMKILNEGLDLFITLGAIIVIYFEHVHCVE